MKIVRWKALVPLTLLLIVIGVAWILLLDTVVRRTIESWGTDIVGAKVELDEADVRLRDGFVSLRGLPIAQYPEITPLPGNHGTEIWGES